ncbi:MAG: hypothetical protein Q7S12_04925 [bacterium]|nr:hypothetical protein [bacterium]
MKKNSKNKNHPELRAGEVFITNADESIPDHLLTERTGWKTARPGKAAYDSDGKILIGKRPIFIQRTELEDLGVDPDKI